MKVLALRCSPRGEGQSKSTLMLRHLTEGMRAAGANVEEVDLRKKTVKNCIGCFSCWTKTPGVCIHKDDMTNELFAKWLEADLVIYATPLYHFLMTATMKAFVERTLPVLQPFFDDQEGRTFHPLRHKHPRFAILCVAGFPEDTVFDQLSYWAQSVYGQHGLVAAEIYRANAEVLTNPALKDKADAILEATRKAGQELVEVGEVSAETMAEIKQEIVEDRDMWKTLGNLFWKTCISEGVTPKEFQEKKIVPRPDSIKTFLLIMSMGFNPENAGDTEAVLQFSFTGEEEGLCFIEIKNAKVSVFEGQADEPTLTVDAPFEVWMDIMAGKLDGQQAFMDGKYKVSGDLALLTRMNELFG